IVGSEGILGKVLTGLTISGATNKPHLNASITRVDVRPERGSAEAKELGEAYNRSEYHDSIHPFIKSDLHSDKQIRDLLASNDIWIHNAWAAEGILDPTSYNPANLELVRRILTIAAELGPRAPKLVLMSSVNSHVPKNWRERRLAGDHIDASEPALPHHHNRNAQPGPGLTRYGQAKIILEKLAEDYAHQYGLDITVPRIGGVNMGDALPSRYQPYIALANDPNKGAHFDLDWEDAVRLSHADFVRDIQHIVERPKQAGHFALYNLISSSDQKVHVVGSKQPE
ncbi:MAG TPA: NAD-dependent epimerase/dehydratase family protein, partial [Magnetospirillaceae bacterium]|nr:NAD-dependent epimerase/dehydratase family protein [Magnetospirillaceae bacterium]